MTVKEANDAIKNEIMHELCLKDSLRTKISNYEYKRAIIEKK